MPEHYRNARGSSPNDRDPFQIAIPYVHARTALERKPAGAQGTSVARRHVAFIVSVHEFQTAAGADTPTLSEARNMSHRAVSKLCQNPICLGRLGLMAERKQSPQVVNKRHIHIECMEGLEKATVLRKQQVTCSSGEGDREKSRQCLEKLIWALE